MAWDDESYCPTSEDEPHHLTSDDDTISSPHHNSHSNIGTTNASQEETQSQAHPDVNPDTGMMDASQGDTESVVEDDGLSIPLPKRPDLSININMTAEEASRPWNMMTEPKPEHRFFEPAFQQALPDGTQIAKDLSAALHPVEAFKFKFDRNKELGTFQKEAEPLQRFKSTNRLTIGVLGPTGVGKSSMICNLCGIPGIAETSCLGSSCTSVPIEYRGMLEGQTSPFYIEIEHLSGTELEDYVKELVWEFIQVSLPSAEDADTEEYHKMEADSAAAWTCLGTAFKQHENEFEKDSWIEGAQQGKYKSIITQFLKWTAELQWPDGVTESGPYTAEAHSVEQWQQELAKFMQQGLWPFIRVVRCFSDSPLLKALTLVDMPGLGDTNMARVRATQRYLQRCDHILVLTRISRAVTDEGLQDTITKTLEKYASIDLSANSISRRKLSLSIVCTHSENIDEKEVLETLCCREGTIKPKEMRKLDNEIKEAKSKSDNKLLRRLKAEKKLWLILARNCFVIKGVMGVYGGRLPGLNVFCISNAFYSKYVGLAKAVGGRHVEVSGIPDLRKFCHQLAAEDQFRDGENFLVAKLAALLNKVTIWTDSRASNHFATHLDPNIAGELMAEIEKMKASLTGIVNECKATMKSAADEKLLQLFRQSNAKWNAAAVEIAGQWKFPVWHWSSFSSFCRHSGSRNAGKHKGTDWNQQLSEKMRCDTGGAWEAYEDGIPPGFQELFGKLAMLFNAMKPAFDRES